MIETNKYFVYPRISLSTNFHDPGTHHKKNQTRLQVPVQFLEKEWRLKPFQDSIAVYDAYLEMLPEKIKLISNKLANHDFEVDFYAQKKLDQIDTEYMLTSRQAIDPILTYGKELKPIELNVACDIKGSKISLAKTKNCHDNQDAFLQDDISYYYNIPTYFINTEEQIRNKEEHINQYYWNYYNELKTELDAIHQSKSWKLSQPLRWVNMQVRKLLLKNSNGKIQQDIAQGSKNPRSTAFDDLFKGGNFNPREKINILKKHMLDKVPLSELCEQYGLERETLYDWQKELFENGASAFRKSS
jgi:hypothetical protein